MHWFRFAVLLLPLFSAGCGPVIDSEQLRLCRLILPALHPGGTEIREIRVVPFAIARSGVRIHYAAREPGGASRVHFVTCGFGGTTFERDRLDLVAVTADERALGEAQLLYLRRFYLAEARAGGAAARDGRAAAAIFRKASPTRCSSSSTRSRSRPSTRCSRPPIR